MRNFDTTVEITRTINRVGIGNLNIDLLDEGITPTQYPIQDTLFKNLKTHPLIRNTIHKIEDRSGSFL